MSSYIDQFIYDPNRDTQRTFEEAQAELKSNKAYSSEEEKLDVDLDNKDTEKNDEKVDEALEKAEKKTDEAVSQLAKYVDAYKKIAFNGRGNYSDVIKSLKEGLSDKFKKKLSILSVVVIISSIMASKHIPSGVVEPQCKYLNNFLIFVILSTLES